MVAVAQLVLRDMAVQVAEVLLTLVVQVLLLQVVKAVMVQLQKFQVHQQLTQLAVAEDIIRPLAVHQVQEEMVVQVVQ